jgi:hypothetical protein
LEVLNRDQIIETEPVPHPVLLKTFYRKMGRVTSRGKRFSALWKAIGGDGIMLEQGEDVDAKVGPVV